MSVPVRLLVWMVGAIGWLWIAMGLAATWGAVVIGLLFAIIASRRDPGTGQGLLLATQIACSLALVAQFSTASIWWEKRRRDPSLIAAAMVALIASGAAYAAMTASDDRCGVSRLPLLPPVPFLVLATGAVGAVGAVLMVFARPKKRRAKNRKPPSRGPRDLSTLWTRCRDTRVEVLDILIHRGLVRVDDADRQRLHEMPLGYWEELDGVDEKERRRILEYRFVGWRGSTRVTGAPGPGRESTGLRCTTGTDVGHGWYSRCHADARLRTTYDATRPSPVRRLCSRVGGSTTAVLLVLFLTACVADLPPSVVEGSSVTVGWSESLTSFNAASNAGNTEGNREIAAVTRDAFARVAGGEVVEDETFGAVEVIDTSTTSFTVRYDLAERTWSDGIPIDAADLLLAWAAGSNATAGEFDAISSDLRRSAEVPTVDDSERRIDVSYTAPVRGWHTALDVAVPAHVVGEMALGIEDPMEAKQAVIDAITGGDEGDLADIAEAWNSGFDLGDASEDLPDALTIGSGPYLVTAVEATGSATDVTLEVNRSYEGDFPPSYERIEAVAVDAPLDDFPDDLDVVQVIPTPDNFVTVRDLERRDHHVSETDSGQLWTLVLRADKGVFRAPDARRAFLRATSPTDLRSAGAGDWEDAYSTSQSLLFAPESDGYEISLEDAGFRAAFESALTDAQVERAQAGVAAGTQVCVLYDNDDAFAAGALRGLKRSVAEAGWSVRDCGEADIEPLLGEGRGWQAVLTRVALPESPSDITALWGGKKKSPLTGVRSKERRRLVAQLDKTADVYDARMLQVAIEAGLIREAVALPLALDPVVTLSARSMNAVLPDSGDDVTLLGAAGIWEPAS